MKFSKRKFNKILGFSALILFFPLKVVLAASKKIINPNLSKEQKNSNKAKEILTIMGLKNFLGYY